MKKITSALGEQIEDLTARACNCSGKNNILHKSYIYGQFAVEEED